MAPRTFHRSLVASLAALAAIGFLAAASAAPAPIRERTPQLRGDAPLYTPLSQFRVVGRHTAAAGGDVPVNDPARAGQLANCAIQSETSIASYQQHVYVGFNDGEACINDLGLNVTGFALSNDGGAAFTDRGVLAPPTAGSYLLGDPALAVDTTGDDAGTLYYASLAFDDDINDAIAVARSTDNGQSFQWSFVPNVASGRDKEWIAVDNSGGAHDGTVYLAWTQFTSGNNGQIELVRSTDHGQTWSPPQILGAGIVQGARIAVGPDGEVIVAWVSDAVSTNPSISWTRSVDGGTSFAPAAKAVTFPTMGHTTYCAGDVGIRRVVNGDIRVLDWPSLAVDTYGSSTPGAPDYNPARGTAYVVYPARAEDGLTFGLTSDGGDEADVFLIRLGPGATSWSPPKRVNDDSTTADQLFPEVAVPAAGRVAVMWTDRREDALAPAPAGNRLMRQWIAVSDDGGATFHPNQPFSSALFPPPVTNPNGDPLLAGCYAGDYDALIGDGTGRVLAAWADNRNSIKVTDGGDDPPVQTIPDPNVYFRSATV